MRALAATTNEQEYQLLDNSRSPRDSDDSLLGGVGTSNVLAWLLQASEKDARKVISAVQEKRPLLFNSDGEQENSSPERAVVPTRDHVPLGHMPKGKSIIQFSSPRFFASVDESVVVLDIIRMGDISDEAECYFETIDSSALAGQEFEFTKDKVTFKPGDDQQQVQVTLIDDGRWNTTTQFKVHLKDVRNSELGYYLFETRVTVVDASFFPSDKLKDVEVSETPENVAPVTVLLEFFKMTWMNPVVRKGTRWCMLVDTSHNFWYFANLFLTKYLLDHILRPDADLWYFTHRRSSLMAYAGLTLVALFCLHLLDYSKTNAKMGAARTYIQNAVIRKYMNYTRAVRSQVHPGDISMGVRRDAAAVVGGYMSCLQITARLSKLLLMLAFKILSPYVFGGHFDIEAIVPMAFFPVAFAIYLPFRQHSIKESLAKAADTDEVLSQKVQQTTTNYNMILDYSRQGLAAEAFEGALKANGGAHKAAKQIMLNTEYFATWVATLVLAGFVVLGGLDVISGARSFGTFVIDLKIIDAFGSNFSAIFDELVDIQTTYPSMMKLFWLLNLPTDVHERKALKREQRKLAAQKREKLRAEAPGTVAVDLMPFVLNLNDNFIFEGIPLKRSAVLNFRGNHEIEQGQLVAFFGGMQCGKKTLLQLLSGRQLPNRRNVEDGVGVFVPAHLRIVTVSEAVCFWSGTLYENITFGSIDEDKDRLRERVMDICNELGISKETFSHMDEVDDFTEVLSESQAKLINIARVLVYNAEVIIFDKPLVLLNTHQGERMMQTLKDHIAERGLFLHTETEMRRPRTVFMSSSNPAVLEMADTIYYVSTRSGITVEGPEGAWNKMTESVVA